MSLQHRVATHIGSQTIELMRLEEEASKGGAALAMLRDLLLTGQIADEKTVENIYSRVPALKEMTLRHPSHPSDQPAQQ